MITSLFLYNYTLNPNIKYDIKYESQNARHIMRLKPKPFKS